MNEPTTTNDIDALRFYLNETGTSETHRYRRALTALVAERDALRKENDELRSRCKVKHDEATAWRPIETAPIDGTVVMLYGDGRVTCGSWIAEQDIMVSDHVGCYPSGETTPAYWQSHDGGFTEEHPATHWMPLPQPPREKEGGGA